MDYNETIIQAHKNDPGLDIKLGLCGLYFEAQQHAIDFFNIASGKLEDFQENTDKQYTVADVIALAAVIAQIQGNTMHKVGLQQLTEAVERLTAAMEQQQ